MPTRNHRMSSMASGMQRGRRRSEQFAERRAPAAISFYQVVLPHQFNLIRRKPIFILALGVIDATVPS